MSKRLKWILAAVALAVMVFAGAAFAAFLSMRDRPQGALDTQLSGVTVSGVTTHVKVRRPAVTTGDKMCWRSFGGNPQRTLARPSVDLGIPERKPLWSRVLDGYMEFPPTYCDNTLYVNTLLGYTWAIDATTGKVRWRRKVDGAKPSSPAIDGELVIVSSKDGTVTALDRRTGRPRWVLRTPGGDESSPVAVDGLVYFGSQDGRLYAVRASDGHVRWAYDTGGRINSSPSIFGRRVCVTTYAGAIVCLNRRTGQKLWVTYVKRDAFRWESFYASASTDGQRLYTISRDGRVVAVRASDGQVVWTQQVAGWGYTTPAVAYGKVFIGGFDGKMHAYHAATGAEAWSTYVGGKILGAPVVIGKLVFFSTHEGRTYALRVSDGKLMWKIPFGKYSPGIATERTYYFSLNGRLLALRGRTSPKT